MQILDAWLRDIPQEFLGKKNIEILITAFARQLQEIEAVFSDLDEKTDLKTATGQNLDVVGTIIPLTRKEAGIMSGINNPEYVISDDRYRQFLKYKLLENTNECTYYDIMQAIRMFWDGPLRYSEDPSQPATMILDTGEMPGTVDTAPLFKLPLIKSAGVCVKLYARTSTTMQTAKVGICVNPGFTAMTTELPTLERDYVFRSEVSAGTNYSSVAEDMLPGHERNYKFEDRVWVAGDSQSVSRDTLPGYEREYKFGFELSVGGEVQSVTCDKLPVVERNISYRSTIDGRSVIQNVMETPINGIIVQNDA